jgi:hypothetical protein
VAVKYPKLIGSRRARVYATHFFDLQIKAYSSAPSILSTTPQPTRIGYAGIPRTRETFSDTTPYMLYKERLKTSIG